MDEVESDGVSTALFVPTVQLAELLGPSLRRTVEGSDVLTSERVLHAWFPILLTGFIELEEFASAVAKKFVKGHDQCHGLLLVGAKDVLLRLFNEHERVFVHLRVDVA